MACGHVTAEAIANNLNVSDSDITVTDYRELDGSILKQFF